MINLEGSASFGVKEVHTRREVKRPLEIRYRTEFLIKGAPGGDKTVGCAEFIGRDPRVAVQIICDGNIEPERQDRIVIVRVRFRSTAGITRQGDQRDAANLLANLTGQAVLISFER